MKTQVDFHHLERVDPESQTWIPTSLVLDSQPQLSILHSSPATANSTAFYSHLPTATKQSLQRSLLLVLLSPDIWSSRTSTSRRSLLLSHYLGGRQSKALPAYSTAQDPQDYDNSTFIRSPITVRILSLCYHLPNTLFHGFVEPFLLLMRHSNPVFIHCCASLLTIPR